MKIELRAYCTVLVICVLCVLPTVSYAATPSPFVGQWQAIDVDGSDIRLAIGGPSGGPFQITWTESYIGFCSGEAGIVRGTAWLNEGDPNLLEADLHVECFTTGASLDLHLTFRYHQFTDTLSARYPNGMAVIWHRPGRPQPPPPALNLRVNYGHDWVESFYEAEHFVYLTVTEGDGVTVKATAELLTEPKEFWGGETGFQTQPEDWDPSPPDIQPGDWVLGRVDNGVGAQVQIGDISGMIDLEADSIQGTIDASWFTEEVDVECFPWGAPEPQPEMKYDSVLPDGKDTYSCSWAGEWDIQYYQDVGVGYFGADGHWVANAFFVRNPHFTIFPEWEWFDGMDWPDGAIVSISVASKPECSTSAESWGFFFNGGFPEDCDVAVGDVVTFADGSKTREHTVRNLAVAGVDETTDTVTGTADPYEMVYVWQHEPGIQIPVEANEYGEWLADLSGHYDIRPGSSGRSEIRDEFGNGTAVDWYVPNTRFTVWPQWNYLEGYEWPDGALVAVSVAGKEACHTEATAGYPEWDLWNTFFSLNFPEGCAIEPKDEITISFDTLSLMHVVQSLAVTAVDMEANTVAGTASFDPELYMLHTWIHGFEGSYMQLSASDGTWLADFGSQGFDLQPGMGGRVELVDQSSNATAAEWWIPNPVFTAFPEQEAVEGWDWPLGASVHLTIDDPATTESPDYQKDETVTLTPWGSGQLWVWFDFAGSYDMKPGDRVTLTDGVTIREHTVRDLAITAVDAEANIVAGTADAYAEVFVWPHATGEQILATADGGGAWLVDFTDVFDLVPDECGRAEIRDEVGNATAVDWCVPPPPRVLVQISDDWFEGQNFAPDEEQSYEIYDAQGGTLLLNGTMQADDRGTAGVWVGDQVDLVPGHYLVVSDGVTTKELELEALAFDVFDPTQGLLQGTAPPPAGRLVWVGIGWESDAWTMEVLSDQDGNWVADFGTPVPGDYLWVAAQVFDPDGDVSEVRPSPRSLTAGRFHVRWSLTNPEEVIYLSWNGSDNLTNAWTHPACPDDLEFFGNAWVTENEGDPSFFFGSLVGWGTTGSWSHTGTLVDIGSISSGCPGSAELPIQTTYGFFEDELRADLIQVQRVFEFGAVPYEHDVRAFIPRLYPADGFTQVLHPDASGLDLVIRTTDDCGLGCKVTDWNGTWFSIHNPVTGLGMIVRHEPSAYPVALWVDNDGGSFTNSSSVLLLQPSGGFVGAVTETEYLCFYDSNWTPSLTLPSGCQP